MYLIINIFLHVARIWNNQLLHEHDGQDLWKIDLQAPESPFEVYRRPF
jgi:hypothetical protein